MFSWTGMFYVLSLSSLGRHYYLGIESIQQTKIKQFSPSLDIFF